MAQLRDKYENQTYPLAVKECGNELAPITANRSSGIAKGRLELSKSVTFG